MDYALENYDSDCKFVSSSLTNLYLVRSGQLDPRNPNTYLYANVILLRTYDYQKGVFIPYEPGKVYFFTPLTREFLEYLHEPEILKSYDNGTITIYSSLNCDPSP